MQSAHEHDWEKTRVFLNRPRSRRRPRSAWRGEEIEGDDDDEDDWEKTRVFLNRPRGRRRPRSAWRGEEIEGGDDDEHDWGDAGIS
jgi:hypothetical protein